MYLVHIIDQPQSHGLLLNQRLQLVVFYFPIRPTGCVPPVFRYLSCDTLGDPNSTLDVARPVFSDSGHLFDNSHTCGRPPSRRIDSSLPALVGSLCLASPKHSRSFSESIVVQCPSRPRHVVRRPGSQLLYTRSTAPATSLATVRAQH